MLLALEGQGCWDPPRGDYQGSGLRGHSRAIREEAGGAREGQVNPPVGPQQFISAGVCRSLPRLGYSRTTLHSSPGVSLPLGTGDNRGRGATAQSSLLGDSPCTRRALRSAEKSRWELTAVTWVSWTCSGWGGKARCPAENRSWALVVSPLPCNAKGGLIPPRPLARGVDSSSIHM